MEFKMKVKKSILLSIFVLIVVYNFIMFLIPIEKNLNYWIVYISTTISILFLGGILYSQLTKKSVEKNIRNTSIVWIAWEYFIFQTIASFYEILYPIYYRTSLVINILLLGINIIILSIISTQKKEIEKVEQKVKEKVFFVKSMQEEIEVIKERTNDSKVVDELQKLSEIVKYCDPMTHSKLYEIENNIENEIKNLKTIIDKNRTEESIDLIVRLKEMFTERNRKAKLFKGMPELEQNDKPSNNRAIIIFCVSIVVLLIIGITSYYSVILPNSQYDEAAKLLANKNYIEAKEKFEGMDGYKDSEEKAKEAMYRYAIDLLEKENYDKAISIFEGLKDYSDSKIQKTQAIYKYASNLFEIKQYVEAEKQYKKIEEYKDSKEKIKESIYLFAKSLLDEKEYTKAAEQFMQLDNYKDSKIKLLEIYNLFGDKDVVYFGKYNGKPIEWQILDTKDSKVLLITSNAIDEMSYNNEYRAVDWENSSLRKWLNETFYNTFDDQEKAKLLKNTGDLDTIFLLSNENVKSYPKLKKCNTSWWIDTRGEQKTTAMYVDENGKTNQEGDLVTKLHGIRPSIWLNLE